MDKLNNKTLCELDETVRVLDEKIKGLSFDNPKEIDELRAAYAERDEIRRHIKSAYYPPI